MAENNLPSKRKRTLNPKLISEDNVHEDAVKRRQAQFHSKTPGTTSLSSRQASVEAVDEPEDHIRRNAGHPKNPNSILEGTDDEPLDEPSQHSVKRQKQTHSHTKTTHTAGHSSRQASVEAIDNPQDHIRRNAGHPKNPNSILEGTDDEQDKRAATEDIEGPELQKETDEEELGMIAIQNLLDMS
jgi:hypothetical protein